MKPIAKWSLTAKLTNITALLGVLGLLYTQAQAIADASPIVFKYQLVGIVEQLNVIQYNALRKELSDLRSQRLMLKESIDHETDAADLLEKKLRLESIEGDIKNGDDDFIRLRCQVEKRSGC